VEDLLFVENTKNNAPCDEGRALTAKEKTTHTQGLVGVLKDLHHELNTAVLQAYGWADAPDTDELLSRLVALNAQRAAEEKNGRTRWLRPAFQDPSAASAAADTLSNSELSSQPLRRLQADLALKIESTDAPTAPQAWPADLPEQVRAVAQVLTSASTALRLPELEQRFKGRGPWKKSLPRILQTLEALDRARQEGDGWRA
jgi:hypothetical protein